MQRVGKGGTVQAGNCEGMMLADDIVRQPLAICRQVAEGDLVVGHALLPGGAGEFELRERETRHTAHEDLVGAKSDGGAGWIVVRKFDVRGLVRGMRIPVDLALADGHGHHFGHSHTLHTTVVV